MLEIDSYCLYLAAEIIGCTSKALIQLAIADQLTICAELPSNFEALRVNAEGNIVDMNQKFLTGSRLVKVPASALRDYLIDKCVKTSFFKSYDEPDIFYQSNFECSLNRHSLLVMKDDLKRLSESLTAQENIIDPNIELPKRADLIDLVSLSKAIAKRYKMTYGEASDWLTNEIEPAQVFYDISGFKLPKRIHEIKSESLPTMFFNQFWWEHPKNESKPMSYLNELRPNGIAISKADAEKYNFIPSSNLEDPLTEKSPLGTADALDVVIRANLIDLVSLSKAIAKQQKTTVIEACEWVTRDIISKQLLVYSLHSLGLPKLFESKEAMLISALCYELWAEYPDTDGIEIDRFAININEVAISKADAEKYFSISSNELEEQATVNLPLFTIETLPITHTSNIININSNDGDVFCKSNNTIKPSPIIRRKDLVNIVALSKIIASHQDMTVGEACDWLSAKIIDEKLRVYNLSGSALPKQLWTELNDGWMDTVSRCFISKWWLDPSLESTIMKADSLCPNEVAILKTDAEKYFSIQIEELQESIDVLGIIQNGIQNEEIAVHDATSAQDYFKSEMLVKLNEAALKFWSNADPAEKDTHPTNEQVIEWLKSQGFSEICARQGAVIIRPEWAAVGRRPTK